MGNASLMTGLISGRTREEAHRLAALALGVLSGASDGEGCPDEPAYRLLAAIAQRLPARRTCASLGWQALIAALEGGPGTCMAREIR